jgi:hypothetical protein
MYFRLCYVTTDWTFGDDEIRISHPAREIEVLIKKRPSSDANPPVEKADGIAVVTYRAEIPVKLHEQAIATGKLSVNDEAVLKVRDEMRRLLVRTLRLARWRTNLPEGSPNQIRFSKDFSWSVDGKEWKQQSLAVSATITITINPQWTNEAASFVNVEAFKEIDEPLAHEMLGEAVTNRSANLRSSLVLAVAAAEIGFKQFVSRTLPNTVGF